MSKIIAEDINKDKIIEYFLNETGQKGKFPTKPYSIMNVLNLQQLEFDFVKEFSRSASKKSEDYRALLSYDEKIIALNSKHAKNECRKRFSLFHEIAHYVIPEHMEKFYLCSDEYMSERTIITLEAEANRLAADFIYQKNTFTEEANNYSIKSKSIFMLKNKYDASYESVSRRFVERHILPCALAVYDKNKDGNWGIAYTVTSPIFKERFFSKIIKDDKNPKILEIQQTYDIKDSIEDTVNIEIVGKGKHQFDVEYFYNKYKVFALIKPKKKKTRI